MAHSGAEREDETAALSWRAVVASDLDDFIFAG